MKINRIFSFILGGALLAAGASCTDEVEYTPAEVIPGNGVYFPEMASTAVSIEQNSSSVSVELLRTNDPGALTVGITSTVTDKDGVAVANVFNIPTQVTFPEGTKSATVPITYDFNAIEPSTDYYVTLKIDGEQTTPYGLVEQTFVLKYAPWGPIEPYKKTTELGVSTLSAFSLMGIETPVYVSQSLIGAGERYRFGDYGELPDSPGVDYVNGGNIYITLTNTPVPAEYTPTKEANRYYVAHMEPFATGDDNTFGEMIYITDVYTYRQLGYTIYPGNTLEELETLSYYDTVTGKFTIYTIYYTGATPRLNADEYFQLPGFKDYSINFSYNGNFVDAKGNEFAVVEAYRSDDVASFTYTLTPGAMTDEQFKAEVEAIKANSDAELIFDAVTNLQFTLESGDYTIVGVGYDEAGNAVCESGYVFTYKTVQVASDWVKVADVDYRDGLLYGWLTLQSGAYLGGNSYKVELQKHKTDANRYRVVNPCGYYYDYGIVLNGNYYLTFQTSSDMKYALVETSYVGVDLSVIGDTKGQWIISSPATDLLADATVDQIAAQYPQFCGVIDADGYLQFPAGLLTLYYENTGMESGYYSNFNDALLEAMNDETMTGQQLAQNLQQHLYGMGMLTIDMYDVINPASAAPRSLRGAATTGGRISGTVAPKAAQKFNLNVPAGASRKVAIRGNKVEGASLLKGGKMHFNGQKINVKKTF